MYPSGGEELSIGHAAGAVAERDPVSESLLGDNGIANHPQAVEAPAAGSNGTLDPVLKPGRGGRSAAWI